MKITFEGKTYGEIFDQMKDMMTLFQAPELKAKTNGVSPLHEGLYQGPDTPPVTAAKAVEEAVEEPVKKPVDDRIAKMQAARKAKKAERDAAKAAEAAEEAKPDPFPAPPKAAPSPAELVALRQKTIDDLQAAYANGKQAEVFELLSRFGDGAKSFRELKPEAFIPIREAIELGALN